MEILKFYNNIGITLGAQTLELGHKGLKKKKKTNVIRPFITQITAIQLFDLLSKDMPKTLFTEN